MEFKFRAVDDRPPSNPSPSSSFNFLSEQALRADFSTSVLKPNLDQMRNPNDLRELIKREEELVREEILLAEIAKRRALELEVRREVISLERELYMRRAASEGFSFQDRLATMQCDPRLRLIHSINERLAFSSCSATFNAFPSARLSNDIAPKLDNPLESNKDKVILLAKPDPNTFVAKRKAETPPEVGANELHPFGLKKKPKEDWSCALCQVTATSERVLNQHLKGKKHKAKEARLVSQRLGKNSNKASSLKKTFNSSKLTWTSGKANSILNVEVEGKSLQQKETGNSSDNKKEDAEDLKLENQELQKETTKGSQAEISAARTEETQNEGLQKVTANGSQEEKSVATTAEPKNEDLQKKTAVKTAKPKKKKRDNFKFVCELCKVGADSSRVIEDHKKGKKHRAKLREHNKTNAVAIKSSIVLSVPIQSQENADVSKETTPKATEDIGKEANQKATENVAPADTLTKSTDVSSEPIPNPKNADIAEEAAPKDAKDIGKEGNLKRADIAEEATPMDVEDIGKEANLKATEDFASEDKSSPSSEANIIDDKGNE
ncbi:hypothetical protein UlMin_002754 [Ulmus minor]